MLLSLVKDGDTVAAHLVSDLLMPLSGQAVWTLATLDGETLAEGAMDIRVDANSAAEVGLFSLAEATGRERDVYVYAKFTAGDGMVTADNLLLLAEPKDLRTADPALTLSVQETDGGFSVTLTAKRFAPYVWLRRTDNGPLPGLSDNFFHLRPGETRTLTLPKSGEFLTADDLRGQLVLRTL